MLLVVAQNDTYARNFGYLFGSVLGKASYHGHHGFGIQCHSLADGIAAFFLSDGGHGASVDNIDISPFVIAYNVKTCFFKLTL